MRLIVIRLCAIMLRREMWNIERSNAKILSGGIVGKWERMTDKGKKRMKCNTRWVSWPWYQVMKHGIDGLTSEKKSRKYTIEHVVEMRKVIFEFLIKRIYN
jgi:hypothetical protein